MSELRDSIVAIAADLDGLGARWAVIGGLAVSARAEPRLTRDVDVAVAIAGDREAEQLVAELRVRGYRVLAIVEQTAMARLATVRLAPPSSSALVDLLFASSGIEAEVVETAERIEVASGLVLPVARRSELIALKLLARDDRHRPQDADDLRALLRVASAVEVAGARAAARLIIERGFARGRDLEAALDELDATVER